MGTFLFRQSTTTLALVLGVCVAMSAGATTPKKPGACPPSPLREIVEDARKNAHTRPTTKNRPLTADYDAYEPDVVISDIVPPVPRIVNRNIVKRPTSRLNVDQAILALELDQALETLEHAPDPQSFRKPHKFGSVAESEIKMKKAQALEAQWEQSGEVKIAHIRFEEKTMVIDAFEIPIGNTKIEIPEVRYEEILTEDELLETSNTILVEARRRGLQGVQLDEFVKQGLEAHLVIVAKNKFRLQSVGEPLSGQLRIHLQDAQDKSRLHRIYKNFSFENGQLQYRNVAEMAAMIQFDMIGQKVSKHIETQAVRQGRKPPWRTPTTREPTSTIQAINGVKGVDFIPGKEAADFIDAEGNVTDALLWEQLEEAKKARDAVDHIIIAVRRRRIPGATTENFDKVTGEAFVVGLDPNSAHNYIWDGKTLWAVDH